MTNTFVKIFHGHSTEIADLQRRIRNVVAGFEVVSSTSTTMGNLIIITVFYK